MAPAAQSVQLQPRAAPVQAPVQAPAAVAAAMPAMAPVEMASPPVQAPQAGTASAPVMAPAAPPVQLPPSAAPAQAPVQAPAAMAAAMPAMPLKQSAPAPAPGLALAPAPQQSLNPAGTSIPVTPLTGSLSAAPAPVPAPSAGMGGAPQQVLTPAPTPAASFGAAPAPSISALLDALSPADRAIVANQSLSSLAGAAGQNLSSVDGQNLSPYSNTTAGALLGSVIATGNPLAPVPAPEVQPLLQAVAAAGVPTPGASSAARPRSRGAVRRHPSEPVLGGSEDAAEAPGTCLLETFICMYVTEACGYTGICDMPIDHVCSIVLSLNSFHVEVKPQSWSITYVRLPENVKSTVKSIRGMIMGMLSRASSSQQQHASIRSSWRQRCRWRV